MTAYVVGSDYNFTILSSLVHFQICKQLSFSSYLVFGPFFGVLREDLPPHFNKGSNFRVKQIKMLLAKLLSKSKIVFFILYKPKKDSRGKLRLTDWFMLHYRCSTIGGGIQRGTTRNHQESCSGVPVDLSSPGFQNSHLLLQNQKANFENPICAPSATKSGRKAISRDVSIK